MKGVMNMKATYTLPNGKTIKLPIEEIKKNMKLLELSEDEAIEMYLEDEGYLDNEEQNELDKKAKESGILQTIHGASADKKERKKSAPRTVKVSDEKKELFAEIVTNLECFAEETNGKVKVEKENKLIIFEINGKTFKIDLIEQRAKKK